MASFTKVSEEILAKVEATAAYGLEISNSDEGWTKSWEKKGITAYSQNDSTGKVCVRGQTTYDSSPLDVFRIIQHKTSVDQDMRQHDVIARIGPDIYVEHVFFNVPWPVTPRDGLAVGFFRLLDDGTILFLSAGHQDDELCAPLDGYVRSELTIAGFVLKPTTTGGTDCTYMLKMDPMGSVPEFLKKKMTSSKPMILDNLRNLLKNVEPSTQVPTHEVSNTGGSKAQSAMSSLGGRLHETENRAASTPPNDISDDCANATESKLGSSKDVEMTNPNVAKSLSTERAIFKSSAFVQNFLSEIERIDKFVCSRMDELEEQLQLSLEKAILHGKVSYLEDKTVMTRSERKRKKNSELQVLDTYISLYKKIEEVQSFSFLNILLCIKISKKHDRVCRRCSNPVYPEIMDSVVYLTCFGQCKSTDGRILRFKSTVQRACAEFSCNDDTMEAEGKLVMFKGGVDEIDLWTLGFSGGLVAMTLIWFLWEVLVEPGNGQTLWNDPAIYLYSFIGNIVVYYWLWAVDVYAWERANINYLLLLDITADHSPASHVYFKRAPIPTLIFLVNLILYYKARRDKLYLQISPGFFPVSLALLVVAYYLYKAVQEREVVHYQLYSPTVLFHIITAPFTSVSLREVILADVLTSMIKVFSNCAYATCYLITGSYDDQTSTLHTFGTCNSNYMFGITSALAILPLWFRFAQCLRKVYDHSSPTSHHKHWCRRGVVWPYSFNAFKYVLSMVVVLFSLGSGWYNKKNDIAYKVIYNLILVISTLYSYWWDVYMDFGLFRIMPTYADVHFFFSGKWSGLNKNLFLRPLLMYKHCNYRYYIAMVVNLILRAVWTLSLIPQGSRSNPISYSLSDQLGPFLATVELIRRCIWLILRLEHEHIIMGACKDSDSHNQVPILLHRLHSTNAIDDSRLQERDYKYAVYHFMFGSILLGAAVIVILSL